MIGKQNLDYTRHDRQIVRVPGPIITTSTTFVDVPGATLTTKDLGELGNYQAWLSISVQQSNNNTAINFRAVINGFPGNTRTVDFGPASANNPQHATLLAQRDGVEPNIEIKLQWNVTAGTGQINDLVMMLDGVRELRVIS